MLDERGVEYQAIGKRLTYWNRDGSDNECDDADFVADQQPDGTLVVEGLTPEQTIAATLGNDRVERSNDGVAELQAENAKLRELVRDMYACISHANEADWFHFERDKLGCGMSCTVNGEACGLCALADRMRELGIEVDE